MWSGGQAGPAGRQQYPRGPRAGVNMPSRLMSGLRAGENTQPTWAARPAGGEKLGEAPPKCARPHQDLNFRPKMTVNKHGRQSKKYAGE